MTTSRKRHRKYKRKKNRQNLFKFFHKSLSLLATTTVTLLTISIIIQFLGNPYIFVGNILGDEPKTHRQTWLKYGKIFKDNHTSHLSASFLAGLAQTESSGRQWTSSDWIFSLDRGLFKVYAPKSSSFGLMQFTEATFAQAKNLCINSTKVESAKSWYMLDGCWFTFFKTRASASDSIETTAAYLQKLINDQVLLKNKTITARNAQRLASIAHLCGASKAKTFIQNNYYLSPQKKCGEHSVSKYVRDVMRNKRVFDTIDQNLLALKKSKRSLNFQ